MGAAIGPENRDVETARLELVRAELGRNPGSFEFFQAVRLLRLMGETVRFRVPPALSFPPSEILGLELAEGNKALMDIAFLGLTGPSGVLPFAYSELVSERARAKDHAIGEFIGIFEHRAADLLYSAWEKSHFPAAWERNGDEPFTQAMRGLAGIATPGLRNRQAISDSALLFYSGLLACQPRSATALEQLLGDYFGLPASVEEFAGGWFLLPGEHQCRLGSESPSEQLGFGAVAGDAIWDQQSRARIRLGPMTLDRYRDFLPNGRCHAEMEALIDFFANRLVDFELQLILAREEVPGTALGSDGEHGSPLGLCSWLKTEEFMRDADDAVLTLGER